MQQYVESRYIHVFVITTMLVLFKFKTFSTVIWHDNMFVSLELCSEYQRLKYVVVCRVVTIQQPQDKRIYQSHYWVTHFANKTCSHGNDLNHVSTPTNQHPTIEVLLETVFPTAVQD
jgi:hypothetical protein